MRHASWSGQGVYLLRQAGKPDLRYESPFPHRIPGGSRAVAGLSCRAMDTHRGEPEPSDGDQPPAVADDELLRQFVGARDEQAFGELVRRHSGLVLGVCRRTLRDEHDAEEAFQATFLVLAAKADRVRVAHTVGPWLYGVAYRIAIRAAAKRARRRETTLPDDLTMIEDALHNVAQCHWRRVLDDELNLLPEKYRSAVVLHYLLGKSNKEVAAELGLSVRTVEGRQRRGKELLKRKLLLRGAGLSLALGALAKTQAASAHASEPLIDATIQAGLSYINGTSAACSADAVRLAQSEVLAMTSSVAPITATLGTLLLLGTGIGLAGGHAPVQGDGVLPLAEAVRIAASSADAEDAASFTVKPAAFRTAAVANPTDDARVLVDGENNPFAAKVAEGGEEPEKRGSETSGVDLFERSAPEQHIVSQLNAPLKAPLDFVQQPLREVAMVIAEEYDVQILFDHAAFDALALSPEMEVTIHIRDVPLRSALRHMFNDLGEVNYIVRDDVLLITTEEAATTSLETHIYDVTDALSIFNLDVESMARVIPESLSRETWTINGTGEGTIQPLGKRHLVVSQSQAAHEEIANFLEQIESHSARLAAQSEAE